MSDDEYLAAAIRVALKKGIICQSMEVDKKKSLREGKFTSGDICLFNKKGNELGKIDKESINQLLEEEKQQQDWINKEEEDWIIKDQEEKQRRTNEEQQKLNEERQKLKEEEQRKISLLKEKGMHFWEYKHIRLDYKGRGITQEINILDIDGERLRGWSDNFSSNEVPTLPELLERLGNEGWEMVSHVVNQDLTPNGTTMHYYNFKREKL